MCERLSRSVLECVRRAHNLWRGERRSLTERMTETEMVMGMGEIVGRCVTCVCQCKSVSVSVSAVCVLGGAGCGGGQLSQSEAGMD